MNETTTQLSRRGLLFGGGVLLAGLSAPALASLWAGYGVQQPAHNVPLEQLPKTNLSVPAGREVATIAGGCFWCVEAIYRDVKGVDKVVSGYSGGFVANPTYEQVCSGQTGHAEAVQIVYDPKILPYGDLLRIFMTTHDPTTLNRQGPDYGTQYRSAIFVMSDKEKATAEKVIKEINDEKIWRNKVVTEVTPFTNFYVAEEYHQDYFKRNPTQRYCQVIIAPKVRKFRAKFAKYLK